MTGETNLNQLLRSMQPVLREDEYVFCTVGTDERAKLSSVPILEFREDEGLTCVLLRGDAETDGITFSYPCRLITLKVHSSLEAIGFLAAITRELAACGISVNAVSAFYHDHLFVPSERAEEAFRVLVAVGCAVQGRDSSEQCHTTPKSVS